MSRAEIGNFFTTGRLKNSESTDWMALSAQAAAAAPKAAIRPPPFAELFRRSKFASYDPAIRQTYQAPPANAHRGDWGLKRPISLRRKNAFISLTSFEHHAHFTEWNHAENQVRFIRRIEEMGGRAEVKVGSPWFKSLGLARTEPPFDSDFCPGEKPELVSPRRVQSQTLQSEQPEEVQPETVELGALGKRGPGAYGTQREAGEEGEAEAEESPSDETPREGFVTHNVQAMSTREFKRYLRSLRAQRQAFRDFVEAHEEIEEKDLYSLATHADSHSYRLFLQSQMQKQFADYNGQKIEPRPHPNGALVYARPTALETLFWTRSKPGFYLQDDDQLTLNNNEVANHIVSFGGIISHVPGSVVVGKQMLLVKNSEKGVRQENIKESVLNIKLDPFKPISISELPRTVGNKPQGLKAIKLSLSLIKGDTNKMGWSNPHPPGSQEYMAMDSGHSKPRLITFNPPRLAQKTKTFSGDRTQNPEDLLSTLSMTVKKGTVADHDL